MSVVDDGHLSKRSPIGLRVEDGWNPFRKTGRIDFASRYDSDNHNEHDSIQITAHTVADRRDDRRDDRWCLGR
jgi:hypothetical protein